MRILKVGLAACLLLGGTNLATAQNLIVNGDAEVAPFDTIPSGWTNIQGSWISYDASADPDTAESGTHYFYEGEDSMGILQQDVNVSSLASSIDNSTQQFLFSGYVEAYDQDPPDQSRMTVQCLDGSGNSLFTFDSDTISSISIWKFVADTFMAPAGTRVMRIRLISTRRDGSANDGYYDNLSLTTWQVTAVKAIVTQTIPMTLAPNPSDGHFYLNASVDANRPYSLYITDITGRIIFQDQFTTQSTALNRAIALPDASKGMYFLHLCNPAGNSQAVSRLFIQ